ncbi:PadR family transcriptional regulator [Arthrobacter sp. A5]|uniref:PadR family transcriptional regulator n=1 Tax=Arthrobacter sp. A5 TaxID=576926 RepID=UPI003DA7E3A4
MNSNEAFPNDRNPAGPEGAERQSFGGPPHGRGQHDHGPSNAQGSPPDPASESCSDPSGESGRGWGPGGWGPGDRGPGDRGHRGGGRGGPGFGGPGFPGFGAPGFPGFGGPGLPGFGRGFGPGGRARKGNVRSAILSLLSQASYNGYGLIKAIVVHTDGAWRPSPGSIYPALAALQAEELISPVGEGRRTEFELTGQGRDYVAGHHEEMAAVWQEVSEEAGVGQELRLSSGKLMGAVRQIGADGTEEQQRSATAALDVARRTIYKLLSD